MKRVCRKMKLLYKILAIFPVILIFSFLEFAKADELEDLASEINDIRTEISNLKSENVKEAVQIDQALQELDNVMSFVAERVSAGDLSGAIATLAFMEKSITDVASSIPSEFKSEVTKKGKEFSAEKMQEIVGMTKGINEKKQEKKMKLAMNMQEVQSKGLDTFAIAANINVIGIKTIDPQEIAKVVQTQTISKTAGSKTLDLSKEMEDQERFSFIIGRSPEDVDLALRQVEVIKSADPKKQRAFEIEKYGKAAGLDMDTISKGINAIYSGDVQTEKQISMDIINKLSQSPDWEVDVPTSEQFDAMMEQDLAAEKAIYSILNSGINFKTGTKGSDVKALSKQVADILSDAGEDQKIIDKVVYKIGRTQYEVWNTNDIAAAVKAELNGEEQVDAFHKLLASKNWGTAQDSLAEQAANIQATLDGRMDDFVDAKYDRLVVTKLTFSEKSELSKVYDVAMTVQTMNAAAEAAKSEVYTGVKTTVSAAQKSLDTYKSAVVSPEDYEKALRNVTPASEEYYQQKIQNYTKGYNIGLQKKIDAVAIEAATGRTASAAAQEAATQASEAAAAQAAEAAASQASQAATAAAKQAAEKAAAAVASQASKAVQQAAQAAAQQAAAAAASAKQAATQAAQQAAQQAAEAAAAAKQAAAQAAQAASAQASSAAKQAAEQAAQQATQEAAEVAAAQAAQAASSQAAAAAKQAATQAAQAVAQEAAVAAKGAAAQAARQASQVALDAALAAQKIAVEAASHAAKEAAVEARTEALAAAQEAQQASKDAFNSAMAEVQALKEEAAALRTEVLSKEWRENTPFDQKMAVYDELKAKDKQANDALKNAHNIK